MVELKQLTICGVNALGIVLNLPRGVIRFIIRNHMILCDDCIDLEKLIKRYPLLCIIQCSSKDSLEEMVEEKVIRCSNEATKLGACLGMKAIDVFTLL